MRSWKRARWGALAVGFAILLAPGALAGQSSGKGGVSATIAAARAQAKSATDDYKASLARLLAIYVQQREVAAARIPQIQALVDAQVASRRELEQAQSAVAEIDAKIAGVKAQTIEADDTLAEILAEPSIRFTPRSGGRGTVRSIGTGSWAIANAGLVQSFFQGRFGRGLPISAFGQTETHNRLGWNHGNAIDVAVNPDSAEGQALIAFLRERGIPFLAFRGTIPGVATGPHIHIGMPSHRL
jgi:hypothetical protein